MDFLSNLANINFEPILQLTFVTLIILSGPAVILLLALRNGDL